MADRLEADKKRRAVRDDDDDIRYDRGYGRYDSMYDRNDRYANPQPQPQPQRLKHDPYRPKRVMLDPDDEGVRWRDVYERRRRGEETRKEDLDMDDLLNTRDYYRNIADKFDSFASSHDEADLKDDNEEMSWDEEIRKSFENFMRNPPKNDADDDY